MRALKVLVVVMGVMLVGGTALLVAAIIDRAGQRKAPIAAQPSRGFDQRVATLPAGARVLAAEIAGDRIMVRLSLAEGGEALMLLDATSGAPLGTIELRPGGTSEDKR